MDSSTRLGSVLGGTQPSIYVLDVDYDVAGFARVFADDTKAAYVVEMADDAAIMQKDIDAKVEWSKIWEMVLNADKCKVMHLR